MKHKPNFEFLTKPKNQRSTNNADLKDHLHSCSAIGRLQTIKTIPQLDIIIPSPLLQDVVLVKILANYFGD